MQAYLDALREIVQPVRAADFPRSLEPMQVLLAELGHPEQHFPAVVVAGSVGKGTTAHQIAGLLGKVTAQVGLYTGPHLHSFRERLMIDGAMISREAFVSSVEAVQKAAEKLPYHFSTFELTTALALYWFAEQGVKIAVLEIGIGGRWDAVNAVENVLAVITTIEREHIAMLGGSLMTIAWHKSGIIRRGGWAFSVEQTPPVAEVLREIAEAQNATLDFVPADELAERACQNLAERGFTSLTSLTERVNEGTSLPARLEQIVFNGRCMVIDGSHTLLGAKRLRARIDELVGQDAPVRLIVGMLRDKAAGEYLRVFDEPRFRITLISTPGHRGFTAAELAKAAPSMNATVERMPDLADALKSAGTEALTVVCGSLRTAALAREILGLLDDELLAEARATREIFEGEDYLRRLS